MSTITTKDDMQIRNGCIGDSSQFYKDIASGPFFGANRPGAKVSQGMIDSFWLHGMRACHKNTFDCIKAFSETDFAEDLKQFDVPTLIIHGDNDDQIVPIGAASRNRTGVCLSISPSLNRKEYRS